MAYLNKVLLIGNLTKDPELRYISNGTAVCDFRIAVNRVYTTNNEKKEETCFIDINVWGRQAESVSKYLQKGSSAFIEGRLQLDQWEDRETGKARSRMRVVAERVQFLNSPRSNTEFDAGGSYQQQYNQQSQQRQSIPPQQQYAPQQAAQPQAQAMPQAMPMPEFSPDSHTQQNAFANAPASAPPFVGNTATPPQAQQPPQDIGGVHSDGSSLQEKGSGAFGAETEDDIPF